jgi:lipoic acid synthetase
VVKAKPDIFNHNLETIPRLYPKVRPGASYQRSLELLKMVKNLDDNIYTKSGLMVGLGESKSEVLDVMVDLREAQCDILTIGQYLQPSEAHLRVEEFIHPEVFEQYRKKGEERGFLYIASSPFVRSSFNASDFSQRFIFRSSFKGVSTSPGS